MRQLLLVLSVFLSTITFAQITEGRLPTQKELDIKEAKRLEYTSNTNRNIGQPNHLMVTGPEQNCDNAISICSQSYSQTQVYTGHGSVQEVIGTCLEVQETNSVWYKFTIQNAGTFGFTLSTTADYDFALYDITSIGCSGVPSAVPVRCNYSSTYGNTGLSLSTSTVVPMSVNAAGFPIMAGLNVIAGQTYALIVDNFSANSSTYSLTFNGTAQIADFASPTFASVMEPCNSSALITFSEPVTCSSLANNGSDFTITGPSGAVTVTSASGTLCYTGASLTNSATLYFSTTGMTTGTYTITANVGSDGNTVLDKCGNNLTNGATVTFNYVQLNPLTVSASPTRVCSGGSTIITVGGGGAGATYSLSSGLSPGVSFVPAITATYTATVTETTGCQRTGTITVAVNPLPMISVAATNSTHCYGDTTSVLTATGTPGTPQISFSNQTGFAIPDNNTTGIFSPIIVSGLSGTATANIVSVNINISHTYDSDLSIYLICPDGTQIDLSSNNGGGGNNYSNTVFSSIGTSITTGTPPFTGTYLPEQPFSLLSACNLNGTWNLRVADGAALDAGFISNWTITFNNSNSYSWLPLGELSAGSGISVTADPATTTIYTVTANDVNGCMNTASAGITVNPSPVVTAHASATVLCNGNTLTLYGSGADSYAWSHSVSDGIAIQPATTETYSVTGMDSNGCSDTASITVNIDPSFTPTVMASCSKDTICFGESIVFIGSGASTYNWTGGVIDGVAFSPIVTATYTVTGTDGNNCTDTATIEVIVNVLPVIIAVSTDSAVCFGSSIALNASGALTFFWSSGVSNGGTFAPSSSANYFVTGVDSNDCIGSDSVYVVVDSCDFVYPGDANYDGIANNGDLLEIGLGFGVNGTSRSSISNNWQGYLSAIWADTVSTGYNLKHADCNGDGTINSDDTLAISLNYGLTHTLRLADINKTNSTGDIYFGSAQTIYGTNQNVAVDVYLGESTSPLTNFYGAAFTIDYNDNTLIQPGSMTFSIDDNNWIGSINTDAIRLTKTMEASETIDGAICRTNHTNTNGFGKIGTLRFTSASTDGSFNVSASNAYYIDNAGLQTPLTSATYSVAISSSVSIQNYSSISNISIYPNPNNGTFAINNLNPKEEYQLEVKDVLGRTVYVDALKNVGTNAEIKLDKATGVYWLQLSSKSGTETLKIVID